MSDHINKGFFNKKCRVFIKNPSSGRKVLSRKRLHVWKKIVISYQTLVREFRIVNGEFSSLWSLMNTLKMYGYFARWL